ncbi:DNA methyltransferase [Gordonia phage Neville]|uniref:DNA methylase n=2 Tax=Nevillevirus TaxID=3044773 RepID=A0A515MH10_9CAUD|nr:DNA methyltransferase [Gordonia phage Neville]YP_010246063.1 DNA methyltransferase [Gordonia phage Trax]AXQ64444.1 DNA methylase [Gordonia phage Neville]QDM55965.1 DNA methylase [Gordonia phage Trax]
MKVGSICSGIGGLDLAVETFFGAELAWYAENAEAPAKVMAEHWPGIPNLGDITTQRWWDTPRVDILCGGYPCQPFSQAGKKKGVNDERHLWPHIRQAIRWIRPRFTILENVSGHRKTGFDTVLGDLAEDGMYARWVSVRASDIGAPHGRDRVFLVAATEGVWQAQALPDTKVSGCYRWPGLLPSQQAEQRRRRSGYGDSSTVDWGVYEPAVRHWESWHGPAPMPAVPGKDGRPRVVPQLEEWMMGFPPGWVTSMGIGRPDAMRAFGNAVCPPQAVHALHLLFSEGWP